MRRFYFPDFRDARNICNINYSLRNSEEKFSKCCAKDTLFFLLVDVVVDVAS